MEITVKELSDDALEENDWRQIFRLEIDGKKVLMASDGGEPEDNILGRDLNFVYSIPNLMKEAYEAGKRGEEFILETIEVKDSEEIWK